MATNLKDYYRDIKGEVLEDKPAYGTSSANGGGARATLGGLNMGPGPSPVSLKPATIAHQTIDAGKQYQEVALAHKNLKSLLDQAREGSAEALAEVVQHYGFDPSELEVTITQPLKDANGNPPEQYGIRLIQSEEEWAAITHDWETAAIYFPGIELHNVPTTRRGKRLAVVMGVGAREFNAVVAAEKNRLRLESALQKLDSQVEKGRREMGVDKMPRVPAAGAHNKPVATETPPQPKAPAKGVMVAK